jgi:hypothetical protein
MSNEGVVTANRTSRSVKPGLSRIAHKKFTTERCRISTPLGRPVEPDV